MPKISVAVPVYNAEKYINECVESILSQDVVDTEIILVDDASTDGTFYRLQDLSRRDKRIKLFRHEQNQGLAATYDEALSSAQGAYIAVADNDDYLSPGYLSLLLNVAEQTGADITQVGFRSFQVVDGQEKTAQTWQNTLQPRLLGNNLRERVALFAPVQLHIPPWGKLYRAEFIRAKKIRFYDVPLVTDLLFHYQGLISAERYAVLPGALYNYRMREDSVSHSPNFPEQTQQYFIAMVRQMNFLSAWLEEINFDAGRAATRWYALDGFMQHYRYFFARQAKNLGAEKVLTVLDEMAAKIYGDHAAAFQTALRSMIMSRLREI